VLKKLPCRTENFLIKTGGFKTRKQVSIDAIVSGIVGRLFQIILLIQIFEIKLNNTVLECGERSTPPMAEGVSQEHEIADNAVGNHGSTQGKSFNSF
jgi:hypothetical protein